MLRVDVVAVGQIIHGGAEVLRVNVRRGHVAGLSAAFARERGVEGEGQEATLGQGLGVEAGCLFLDSAEGAADGDGGQLARGVLGDVEVGGKGDAVAVVEGDLRMIHLVALREHLVPLLRQCQFLFHTIMRVK